MIICFMPPLFFYMSIYNFANVSIVENFINSRIECGMDTRFYRNTHSTGHSERMITKRYSLIWPTIFPSLYRMWYFVLLFVLFCKCVVFFPIFFWYFVYLSNEYVLYIWNRYVINVGLSIGSKKCIRIANAVRSAP